MHMTKRIITGSMVVALLMVAAFSVASCGGGGASNGVAGDGDTHTEASNDFSFVVCGDPHGRTDLLGEIIGQLRKGEFLVIVGDLTTGTGMQEMRMMMDFLEGEGVEYHVIPGDNDMPQGDPSNFRAVFGPDFYSLDVQQSHLVFLDDAVPGIGCPSDELAWLRDDLVAVRDKLVLGFAHVPPGAPVRMGDVEAMDQEAESNLALLDYLEQAGAPVIYCGHLHVYMLYSSGPPRVVVTGGAGANPHMSERSGGYYHFLRVTVQGNQVSEEVIRL